MRSIETTFYAGIDYDFCPDSYWAAPANSLEAALRNMKGQRRRQIVQDYYAAGKLEELGDSLLTDSLDDEARKRLGLIHPTFMGGEYLPNYSRRELEVVRIELESTTCDVISLRTRPVGSRIVYSVVDEYESEFILPQQTSMRPFSLLQLIHFLDSLRQDGPSDPSWYQFGFVLSFNQINLENGADLEDLQNFTRIHSDFYPASPGTTHKKSRSGRPARANESDKSDTNGGRVKLMIRVSRLLGEKMVNDLMNNLEVSLFEGPESLISVALPISFDEHFSVPRSGQLCEFREGENGRSCNLPFQRKY